MKNNKGFTIIELVFVVGVFIVMIAVLGPFIRMVKIRSNRIECADNLRKISLALHEYAAKHDGAFPVKLDELYPDYMDDRSRFDCPASKSKGTMEKPDYVYTEGLTELSPLKTVILEDAAGNHGKNGKNILMIGGAVAKR